MSCDASPTRRILFRWSRAPVTSAQIPTLRHAGPRCGRMECPTAQPQGIISKIADNGLAGICVHAGGSRQHNQATPRGQSPTDSRPPCHGTVAYATRCQRCRFGPKAFGDEVSRRPRGGMSLMAEATARCNETPKRVQGLVNPRRGLSERAPHFSPQACFFKSAEARRPG